MFSSIRFFYLISKNYTEKILDAELVIIWISIGVIFNFIIPTFFSFIQYNGIAQYLGTAALIALILHLNVKSEFTVYKKYLSTKFNSISKKMLDWKVLVIFAVLLPVLLWTLRPPGNFDAMGLMNFMLDWMNNLSIPYERAHHYVPVWELAYLPSMVISNSDSFLWFNSLKPIIILGLGTYLIGRQIQLPKYLIWISVFSAILYSQIWIIGPTVGGSLKNDYIVGAGVVLLIYSCIRSVRFSFDRVTNILFILGIVLATIKYSGFLFAAIAFLAFIVINRHKISQNKKNAVLWSLLVLVVFASTTGHYVISNFLETGNPFYNIKVGAFGLNFPYKVDRSNTTILAHSDDPEVWKSIFPLDKISNAGLFFPLLFTFGFLGTAGVLAFTLFRFIKTRKLELLPLILSFFLLFTWIGFLVTPFSAGGGTGSISYILELKSIRYIIGALFVTELFFTYVLWRLKIPQLIIFSLIGINVITKFWILLSNLPTRFDYSIIVYPIIFIVGLFIFRKYVHKTIPNVLLIGVFGVSIFIFGPIVMEDNRYLWIQQWGNVNMKISDLPPSQIYLIDKPDGEAKVRAIQYAVSGSNFQHSVEKGNLENLIEFLSTNENNWINNN